MKSGVIGREDGERLRQAALARKDELREQAARYAEIAEAMMRGEAPSVQTMEWIDPWYREVMKPALELMDPQAREVVDLDIIRRAGRVPEDRIKEIRRGLNGDDPEAVIDSAGWLGRLRDEMPELVPELEAWLPRGEYDRAVAIADAIDAGYPAAEIMEELPRPHIRDMLHRPDPLEGDGIELELFNEGGGEAGDGPGGEAEGPESDVQTAIRRPKGVPGRSGKPKGPSGKSDDPLPLPPIPMPGGGTEERPDGTSRQIPGSPQQTGDFGRDAREFQEFLRTEKVLEPVDPDEFGQPRDVTAERANDEYAEIVRSRRPADRKNEPVEPAYQIGQPVHDFNIGDKTDLEFVRAITRNGSKAGEFMMLKQDYERILKKGGPGAVKDAWGLANEPEMVLPVNPKNTTVRVGSAAANRFGSGGGLQFEMTGELRRSWFGKPVEIGRSSD